MWSKTILLLTALRSTAFQLEQFVASPFFFLQRLAEVLQILQVHICEKSIILKKIVNLT